MVGSSVEGVKTGDEVACLLPDLGGYAAYALSSSWTRKPADVSWGDAAALPDGRAIVTGGLPEAPARRDFTPISGTELWDPATNLWRQVAPVNSARAFGRLVVAQ